MREPHPDSIRDGILAQGSRRYYLIRYPDLLSYLILRNSIICQKGNWGNKFTPSHRIRILILVLSKIDFCCISTFSFTTSADCCLCGICLFNRENDEIEHSSSCYRNVSSLRICLLCCVFIFCIAIRLCFLSVLLSTYLSKSDIILIAVLFLKSGTLIYEIFHEDKVDD